MVLVSHRYKFIYIKTIKTASTTVEDFFQRFCLPKDQENMYISQHGSKQIITTAGIIGSRRADKKETDRWYSHIEATQIQNMIGSRTWYTYFKFTVVRNPWDKVVSIYHHKFGPDPKVSFKDFVTNSIKNSADWKIYTIKNEPCCNFYIRFENLEEDIERVCRILKLPYNKNRLQHYKAGSKISENYRDYYDDETKEIVRKAYEKEIKYFKYVF